MIGGISDVVVYSNTFTVLSIKCFQNVYVTVNVVVVVFSCELEMSLDAVNTA